MMGLSKVRQAAVLPYKYEDDALLVMLITSRRTRRWVIPKGFVEPGLTGGESAEFEAFEEAGISGQVDRSSIGSYSYRKGISLGGFYCRVRVYPMEVKQVFDAYPDAGLRERRWMPIDQAVACVDDDGLRKVLTNFRPKRMASPADG